jgi:transcriptional regulator with XRE-family HTH domain
MTPIDLHRIENACRLTILRLRSECRITQEKLAERTGLSRQYISRVGTLGKRPQPDILYRFDLGFGLPLGTCFSEMTKLYIASIPHYSAVAEKKSVVWKTGKKSEKSRS